MFKQFVVNNKVIYGWTNKDGTWFLGPFSKDIQ